MTPSTPPWDTCVPDHPRPQLQRAAWTSLDGAWDFAIDRQAELTQPHHVPWTHTINVPFAPETSASGVEDTSFFCAVWYRRTFHTPTLQPGERLILHFGAVDYEATVWLNGTELRHHSGGYTPFSVDITNHSQPSGPQEIVVRAMDDPADLEKPRGKQDWQLAPHSIWYPRTTGIWQTVWLETVPSVFIGAVQWSANLEHWELGLSVKVQGTLPPHARLRLRLRTGDQAMVDDTYAFINSVPDSRSQDINELHRRIALSDPGIDDFRNGLLWSPDKPTIIDATLDLLDDSNRILDSVLSYTALRAIAIQGDRFILNGRPFPLRLVLDQGYWPESGQTPPNEEALLKDVLLVKALGFNGVRMHQKVEDPRFLYWADHLGLLVWEEMPSAYRYTKRSVERLTREWIDVINRDLSHPCIVSWVPFNESWGVPDLPDSAAQRHYVQALYHLTKTMDPSRPVIGNDGWESVATDIIGIHDYDDEPQRIAKRYRVNEVAEYLFEHERPGGRILRLPEDKAGRLPIVLTEFGGTALRNEQDDTWGYSTSTDVPDFLARYAALLEVVRALPALAGFCYTQFTDTYQEANGLLYADRTPKANLDDLALATSGTRTEKRETQELPWRKRLNALQR